MNLQIINDKLNAQGFPGELLIHHIGRDWNQVQTPEGKWWLSVRESKDSLDHRLLAILFGKYNDKSKNGYLQLRILPSGEIDLSKQTRKTASEFKKLKKEQALLVNDKQLKAKSVCEQLFEIWAESPSDRQSSYLNNKGFTTHAPYPAFARDNMEDVQSILIVPGFDGDGNLWTIQSIYTKTKTFQKNSRTKDIIHILGCEPKDYRKICPDIPKALICEGYATALACALATDLPTFCCFSVSNLEYGVTQAKKKYPNAELVICADNDAGTLAREASNPGLKMAFELALKYELKASWPNTTDARNKDFCDLWPDFSLISDLINSASPYSGLRLTHHALLSQSSEHALTKKSAVSQTKKRTAPKVSESLESLVPETAGILIDVPHLKLSTDSKDEPVQNNLEIPPKREIDYSYLVHPVSQAPGNIADFTAEMFPERGVKKGILSTINNFRAIMDFMGITLRYNTVLNDYEIFIPGEWASQENWKTVMRARVLDLCIRAGYPKSEIDDYIAYISDKAQFNPVAAWIESTPWDKVSRIPQILNTITCTHESDETVQRLKKLLVITWMVSAVKAAYSATGFSAHGMLVFQGIQGLGKTSWLKSLVPRELNLAAEGKNLDPGNKDTVKQIVKYWLVELGELDHTFKKAEVSALKNFITRDYDEFRPAYARSDMKFPRRTVFFGSVNDDTFLIDPTGNRRYWTLEVEKVDYNHSIDTQQLWAEMKHLADSGHRSYLNREEEDLLNSSNAKFEQIDPIEEWLIKNFDWEIEGKSETAGDLAQAMGFSLKDKHSLNSMARIAKKLAKGRTLPRTKSGRVLWMGKKREDSRYNSSDWEVKS